MRDAWLGDPMPNQGENAPLEVLPGSGGGAQVEILRGFAPSPVVIGRAKLALSKDRGYSQLLVDAEQLSRGSFVTVLKQAGFPGSAHARKPDVAVPEDIEKLLTEMSFCSQFRAVRRLHELTGTQGESPALLGALVRGYANLGMLTEFHWHPAHQVFKSRALLYAQRMTATADDRISGQWHKAYALAAAGLPALALEELAAADKKPDPPEKKPVPKKPAWVDMIAAYCHYDVEKLKPAKTTPSLASGVAWLLGQNGAAASHPRKPESSFASLAWLLGYRAGAIRLSRNGDRVGAGGSQGNAGVLPSARWGLPVCRRGTFAPVYSCRAAVRRAGSLCGASEPCLVSRKRSDASSKRDNRRAARPAACPAARKCNRPRNSRSARDLPLRC